MHDAMVVQVSDGGKRSANQIGRVFLVVVAFAADAVEKFAAKSQVGDEVEVIHGFEVVDESEDVLVAHGDLFEYSDFVTNLRRDSQFLILLFV